MLITVIMYIYITIVELFPSAIHFGDLALSR